MIMLQTDHKSVLASKNPELTRKASLLKDSAYFVFPGDGAEYVDKQCIFLVLAGLKPISEVSPGCQVKTDTEWGTVPDDSATIGTFLESLELKSSFYPSHDGHVTMAVVALRTENINRYIIDINSDASTVGRLFGYPESAVLAFVQGKCMPIAEQEWIEQQAGLPEFLPTFRFSRDHWQEELMVLQKWHEVLKLYELT
jgi:hypothetical protein